jgi:hypothetical protein
MHSFQTDFRNESADLFCIRERNEARNVLILQKEIKQVMCVDGPLNEDDVKKVPWGCNSRNDMQWKEMFFSRMSKRCIWVFFELIYRKETLKCFVIVYKEERERCELDNTFSSASFLSGAESLMTLWSQSSHSRTHFGGG